VNSCRSDRQDQGLKLYSYSILELLNNFSKNLLDTQYSSNGKSIEFQSLDNTLRNEIERSVYFGNRTHDFTKEGYRYLVCCLTTRPQKPYSSTGRYVYIWLDTLAQERGVSKMFFGRGFQVMTLF